MSRKYNNFIEKLEKFQCHMLTSLEDMNATKKIAYECSQKHLSELSIDSFINKTKPTLMKNLFSLCATCETRHKHEIEMKPRFDELNFILISFNYNVEGNRKVTYKCHCGNVSETDWRNIKKKTRTSACGKCQNDKNKVNYEVLFSDFYERGCELLTTKQDYKNNKQKLNFRCKCGKTSEIVYHDLMRGRLCGLCKQSRTKETMQELYGVDNAFKSLEIKEKIKQKHQERLGVDYPQQHPDVRQKTETTCLEKYGRKWAFTAPEVYEKIKKIMIEKYGVQYPFQNSAILAKIKMTCQDKYGSNYYITSKTCRDKMKLAHGVEYYGMSKEFRSKMMEKYGAEYFIQSEACKQQMMEKYGAEYAMQCPMLFRKACASSYKRKPYIWNNQIFMVLGYENKALDDLMKKENITIVYAGESEEIPLFEYMYIDQKKHLYYPDIYCPEDNRIIEVKSIWTYNSNPLKTLYKGLCVSEDYIFELRIYNTKNVVYVIEIIKGEVFKLMGPDFIMGETIKNVKI